MSGIRSLSSLSASASTSRVLNLHNVAEASAYLPEYSAAPFFHDPILNQAVIVKHRLRSDEAYLVPGGGPVGTKIIFPLDRADLRVGGRSIFVNERGYLDSLLNVLGDPYERFDFDFETLRLLDAIPSLDPFLVREQLKRHNRSPADCYFSISPADAARMQTFAEGEMLPLIKLALQQDISEISNLQVSRYAQSLLTHQVDLRLEPLRQVLGLEGNQFREGIFGWKGFIFYKWQFTECLAALSRIGSEMDSIVIKGLPDQASLAVALDLKKSVREKIRTTALRCAKALSLYDDALGDLVKHGQPAAFRAFLLDAPMIFVELGHMIGMVSHVASYWGYRFKAAQKGGIQISEFLDILSEFSVGLENPNH